MTRTLSPLDETKLNPQNEEESQAATAADVAVEDEAPSKDEPARRGPGRPKGSLNQKNLESMAQAEEDCRKVEALGLKLEEPVKLKLGRPKGAWNQKRIYREVAKLVEAAQRGGVEGWRANGRTPQRAQERKALEKEAGEKVMVLMQAEQERLQRDENDV